MKELDKYTEEHGELLSSETRILSTLSNVKQIEFLKIRTRFNECKDYKEEKRIFTELIDFVCANYDTSITKQSYIDHNLLPND